MRIFPEVTQDEEFRLLGVAGFRGALNDRQYGYLGYAGRTGSLSDRFKQGSFSPQSLFLNSEEGVWFESPDLNTLFQENTGQTAVTAPAQTVGLHLDQSRGLVRGAQLVSNGTFDTNTTGWTSTNSTISVVSGALQMAAQVASPAATIQTISGMTIGRTYEVTATYWQGGTGGTAARVSFFAVNSQNNSTSTPLTASLRVVATSTSASISLQSFGTASTLSFFDNISIRELPGNHAIQATAGSRPTYRKPAAVAYLEDDGGDSLNWTATAGNYTIARVNSAGTVTILTAQALSGSTDMLLDAQQVAYVAVNRTLTSTETTNLTTYLQGLAL